AGKRKPGQCPYRGAGRPDSTGAACAAGRRPARPARHAAGQEQGMSPQLPLHWPTPPHFRLEDFDAGGNDGTVAAVRALAQPGGDSPPLLLVGPEGSGKTHLAIATATLARQCGRGTAYVALSRWSAFDADALAALAAHDLVIVD